LRRKKGLNQRVHNKVGGHNDLYPLNPAKYALMLASANFMGVA